MIQLTQRQINHGVFGLMTVLAWLSVAFVLSSASSTLVAILPTIIYCLICSVLWFAYWRGWEYACQTLIVLLTLVVAVGMPEYGLRNAGFSHIIYVVPVTALVLTGPGGLLGSAVVLLISFAVRAGGGAYTDPIGLIAFVLIIGGMFFSRMAVDNVQRLDAAKREAEAAHARAEAERISAEQKASELEQRSVEQQRLLELVAMLETPTITVADGVLLAPIVGALDSHRAQTLTSRLLQEVTDRRAGQVILDIGGVTAVDTQVAQALLQTTRALRLLGCQVTLTGISAAVATTLTQLGIALDGVTTARSPQEVLAHAV